MAVRFILGRAGTGKTHRCLSRVIAAMNADPLGPPIFILVPRQSTFTIERDLATSPDLRGGAFCRARVVSFDTLGRHILDDCGGSAVPEITSYGRQMILGLLLRKHQPQLQFFSSVARQSGLAIKLDATFGELERSGQSAPDLKQLAEDIQLADPDDADGSALSAKLHDLHLIYDAYCKYLGQERLDPHRRLQQVLHSIESCSILRNAAVHVDGFLDFSQHERQVLAAIAKTCHDLEITLLLDPDSPTVKDPHTLPDDLSLFHKTEEAYRRLHFTLTGQNIVVDPPVLLRQSHRFTSPDLTHIEQSLFSLSTGNSQLATGNSVELIEAPNRRAESDIAASRVRDLLASGHRLRDIAVLVREPEPYMELLSASFREHELPHFLDRRRSAAHHPLLQFMRAALQAVLHPYAHDAMMTLLKSGLSTLTPPESDELENYVLLHRVRGHVWASKESWHARRTKSLGEDEDLQPHQTIEVQRIDELRRRFVDRLTPFVEKLTAATTPLPLRTLVLELFQLFERFNIRKTIADWMADAETDKDLEQRAEHEQVWSELVSLFDQMCDLLGDEPVTLADFLEILESGLETFDLGLAPPTVDQVLIGLVDRTRGASPRIVILVGVSEGVFPRVTREDSVLTDSERRELRTRTIETDPDSVRRQLDESLLGYIAMTRASQRLIVTRAMSDDSAKPMAPSIFWHELRATCPTAPLTTLPATPDEDPSLLSTPRQLVTALMNWVRSAPPTIDNTTYPALYQFLATSPTGNWELGTGNSLDTMRYRAWHALTYTNDATLSPETRFDLFPSPLTASASQLESFAACPFKHFAQYGLRLQPRVEQDPTAMDLGIVYHETLDRLVKSVLEQKLDWTQLTESQARTLIETCAAEVGKTLRNELMLSNARNRYLLTRIQRTIEKVAAAQKAMAARGKFLPAHTELTFGFDGAKLPPLRVTTPHGYELRIRGKIDRVDLLENGAAFSVVDYKMKDRRLNYDELRHGLSVQLLTYLLVLDAHGEKLTGRKMTPAAAFYVKLLRNLQTVDHPSEGPDPLDPAFPLRHKPRGVLDARFATTFDSELEPGTTSKVIAAQLKKDNTFSTRGSDCCTDAELRALLDFVHKRVGELADQIIDGNVDVRPYKMATTSACVNCDFRPLCRFHVRTNQYLNVEILGREGTLERILSSAEAPDAPH